MLLRESEDVVAKRWSFHCFSGTRPGGAGDRSPTAEAVEEVYGPISKAEKALLASRGVPMGGRRRFADPSCFGKNLNEDRTINWVAGFFGQNKGGFGLVFLDQVLSPDWINLTDGRLLNAHSAVLPFARGMHAIEQLAARGDPTALAAAAGASLHYVTAEVDAGPVVSRSRIAEPFSFPSVWHLKAACYLRAFDLLIDVARGLMVSPPCVPLGEKAVGATAGEAFYKRNYTRAVEAAAEGRYLEMRKMHGRPESIHQVQT